MIVLFFLDFTGNGHFEVSRVVYTSHTVCDGAAQEAANTKSNDVMEVWSQCMPVSGVAT